MGTIQEFPQWRAQRLPQRDAGGDAQVVIFPGVRIERGEAAGKPAPGDSRQVTSDGGRQSR